jgi:hypothetical protein
LLDVISKLYEVRKKQIIWNKEKKIKLFRSFYFGEGAKPLKIHQMASSSTFSKSKLAEEPTFTFFFFLIFVSNLRFLHKLAPCNLNDISYDRRQSIKTSQAQIFF